MQTLYYIAGSPLVKVFLPEWQDAIERDPDVIYDMNTPFEFDVDTGSRCIHVAFNKPMTPPGGSFAEQKDVLMVLTGGETGANSRATDWSGIVLFDPKVDMAQMLDAMAMMDDFISEDPKVKEAAIKKRIAEQRAAAAKIKETRKAVQLRSEQRILRHMRMTHHNLIKQWQTNAEQNVGKYPPSFTEQLGMYALRTELQNKSEKSRKINEKVNEIMAHQVV